MDWSLHMIKNKTFKVLVASTLILPLALNAEESFFKDKLPSIIKNIGNGFENGEGKEAIEVEAQNASLKAANDAIDKTEENILANSNFTYFDFNIGTDVLGLDGTDSEVKTEAMTVYRLYEDDNLFLFNQTSAVGFDSRTTLNLGFGARHINDAETVIVGASAFYDYELDSEHKRTGFGVELLTSLLELRANKYSAESGTITYEGINETALDGHDIKLTANMPYFYSSNLFFEQSQFEDNLGYSIKADEWGIGAEILPNLTVQVSQQKKEGSSAETIASINYSIALGSRSTPEKKMQDGVWTTKFTPIREKLYKPVQRENRIMKKAIKLGVTVSGY